MIKMNGGYSKNQFYSYLIFFISVILFFAILAVFFSYMEFGKIVFDIPTTRPSNQTPHIFEWMRDDDSSKIEPITDLTYRDNKELENNIYKLKNDPNYLIEIHKDRITELEINYGIPYPNLYYVEPFENSGSLKNVMKDFINEFTFQGNLLDPSVFEKGGLTGYGSGKRGIKKINDSYKNLVELQKKDFSMIPNL